jgi:hypothetical protein
MRKSRCGSKGTRYHQFDHTILICLDLFRHQIEKFILNQLYRKCQTLPNTRNQCDISLGESLLVGKMLRLGLVNGRFLGGDML